MKLWSKRWFTALSLACYIWVPPSLPLKALGTIECRYWLWDGLLPWHKWLVYLDFIFSFLPLFSLSYLLRITCFSALKIYNPFLSIPFILFQKKNLDKSIAYLNFNKCISKIRKKMEISEIPDQTWAIRWFGQSF